MRGRRGHPPPATTGGDGARLRVQRREPSNAGGARRTREHDPALVVEREQLVDQMQAKHGKREVVPRDRGQILEPAREVVAERSRDASPERRGIRGAVRRRTIEQCPRRGEGAGRIVALQDGTGSWNEVRPAGRRPVLEQECSPAAHGAQHVGRRGSASERLDEDARSGADGDRHRVSVVAEAATSRSPRGRAPRGGPRGDPARAARAARRRATRRARCRGSR